MTKSMISVFFACFIVSCGGADEVKSPVLTEVYILELAEKLTVLEQKNSLLEKENQEFMARLDEFENTAQILREVEKQVQLNGGVIGLAERRSIDNAASIALMNRSVETLKKQAQVRAATKKQAIKKKKQKASKSLQVSVSNVSVWGGDFVAVVHIPGVGYKTLSKGSPVGNGWTIFNVQKDSVGFVHKAGDVKKVLL